MCSLSVYIAGTCQEEVKFFKKCGGSCIMGSATMEGEESSMANEELYVISLGYSTVEITLLLR